MTADGYEVFYLASHCPFNCFNHGTCVLPPGANLTIANAVANGMRSPIVGTCVCDMYYSGDLCREGMAHVLQIAPFVSRTSVVKSSSPCALGVGPSLNATSASPASVLTPRSQPPTVSTTTSTREDRKALLAPTSSTTALHSMTTASLRQRAGNSARAPAPTLVDTRDGSSATANVAASELSPRHLKPGYGFEQCTQDVCACNNNYTTEHIHFLRSVGVQTVMYITSTIPASCDAQALLAGDLQNCHMCRGEGLRANETRLFYQAPCRTSWNPLPPRYKGSFWAVFGSILVMLCILAMFAVALVLAVNNRRPMMMRTPEGAPILQPNQVDMYVVEVSNAAAIAAGMGAAVATAEPTRIATYRYKPNGDVAARVIFVVSTMPGLLARDYRVAGDVVEGAVVGEVSNSESVDLVARASLQGHDDGKAEEGIEMEVEAERFEGGASVLQESNAVSVELCEMPFFKVSVLRTRMFAFLCIVVLRVRLSCSLVVVVV